MAIDLLGENVIFTVPNRIIKILQTLNIFLDILITLPNFGIVNISCHRVFLRKSQTFYDRPSSTLKLRLRFKPGSHIS